MKGQPSLKRLHNGIDIVISNLERIPEKVKNPILDMATCLIWQEGDPNTSACKSVACLAGWYAFLQRHKTIEEEERLRYKHHYKEIDSRFFFGMNRMAEDLGFTSTKGVSARENMNFFFRDNEDLWGNQYHSKMFVNNLAYGISPCVDLTIGMIIQHLKEVQERIGERLSDDLNKHSTAFVENMKDMLLKNREETPVCFSIELPPVSWLLGNTNKVALSPRDDPPSA